MSLCRPKVTAIPPPHLPYYIASPPSSPPSEDEPLPPQPVQIGLSWLAEWDDIHQDLPETDPDVVVRVNYKVSGCFSNMNAANHGDRLRGLVLGKSSGYGGGGGDLEGLPPMQHQALAHRPLPEMDYDWEPPLTVIPESENAYDELVRI